MSSTLHELVANPQECFKNRVNVGNWDNSDYLTSNFHGYTLEVHGTTNQNQILILDSVSQCAGVVVKLVLSGSVGDFIFRVVGRDDETMANVIVCTVRENGTNSAVTFSKGVFAFYQKIQPGSIVEAYCNGIVWMVVVKCKMIP